MCMFRIVGLYVETNSQYLWSSLSPRLSNYTLQMSRIYLDTDFAYKLTLITLVIFGSSRKDSVAIKRR